MDLDGDGQPRNRGDLWAQTVSALGLLFKVIAKAEMRARDVIQIHVFYRTEIDEPAYRAKILNELKQCPNALLVLTPLMSFPSEGAEVEIDAIVIAPGDKLAHQTVSSPLVRSIDRWTFTQNSPGKTGNILEQAKQVCASIHENFEHADIDVSNLIRVNAYFDAALSSADIRAIEEQICIGFRAQRPTYHGVQLPCALPNDELLRLEAIAVSGVTRTQWDGDWKWPHELDFAGGIRVDDVVCMGAQLPLDEHGLVANQNDIAGQTHQVMQSLQTGLNALESDFGDLAKVNAYWVGEHDLQRWATNVGVRGSYCVKPGPASTGIECKSLSVDDALISVDCLALCEKTND